MEPQRSQPAIRSGFVLFWFRRPPEKVGSCANEGHLGVDSNQCPPAGSKGSFFFFFFFFFPVSGLKARTVWPISTGGFLFRSLFHSQRFFVQKPDPSFLGFWRCSGKEDPWKEWGRYPWRNVFWGRSGRTARRLESG